MDEDAVLSVSGRNGQSRKVFRAFPAAMAGPVPARLADPGAAETVVEVLAVIVP